MSTINYNKSDVVINNSLVNFQVNYYQTYYDREFNTFIYLNTDEIDNRIDLNNLVLCPCLYLYKRNIWKRFYELLTDEETVIADSYYERKGYFEYLRETGLLGTYEEAESQIAVELFETWLKANDIPFDWNNVITE